MSVKYVATKKANGKDEATLIRLQAGRLKKAEKTFKKWFGLGYDIQICTPLSQPLPQRSWMVIPYG